MKGVFLKGVVSFALGLGTALATPKEAEFTHLDNDYQQRILPLLDRYCLACHDQATSEGELDLERFNDLTAVRNDPKTWQGIVSQLETGEMPPTKKKDVQQPTPEERAALIAWAKSYLATEARAQAGDPGPVLLRRLSNSEYTYTVRDLTGVDSLDPLREFPVDSASGEGFTNSGGGLVMSPALFEKYLEAGKEIADHAVLLPDGFRFSASTSRTDHAKEILTALRSNYLKNTGGDGINFNYTSQVRGAAPEGEGEGRLKLTPSFAALIEHRDALRTDPTSAATVAADSGLNAKYLSALTQALLADEPAPSFLLDHLRQKLRTAKPEEAVSLAAEVRRWQDRLWKFNNVGHLGLIRPWQEPVTPITTSMEVRLKLGANTTKVYLSAIGFGTGTATVEWQRARLERPGRTPILMRDLKLGFAALQEIRTRSLTHTSRYLEAASRVRKSKTDLDLAALSSELKIDAEIVGAWTSYLGLATGKVAIKNYLTTPIHNGSGHKFISGWTIKGVADFSLMGNASDRDVKVPGDLRAHRVVVHPRPERWIAAGWMSPLDGRVKITPHVRDAHDRCGNGVSWSLTLHRGSLTRVLRSANLDLGKVATIAPVPELEVLRGDLISVTIGARDNSHICDLTEIDLSIEELGAKNRKWSLAGDCADDMQAGNPHPDQHGNLATWHFYGGMNDQRKQGSGIVPGSLVEEWLNEKDPARARELAHQLQVLLSNPLRAEASDPDRAAHEDLTSLNGPLFGTLDFATLSAKRPQEPRITGEANHLVTTPSILEFELPASLIAGAELVVRGVVQESSDPEVAVQMMVGTSKPPEQSTLRASEPIVVHASGPAREKLEEGFDDFRKLFPAAMCYVRVVPADEVVTLQLYHREDDHLARLMLNAREKARIDQLWEQLTFVSREPQRLITAYEQIWQFATQDADPKKFEPMEGTIRERAAAFEKTLVAAQPTHLDALIAFAPRIYRRPLPPSEQQSLRDLYQRLREERLSHEEAFRLTLARLFSAAAFLYKSEAPARKSRQGPVNNWELATRLSYFLTSSTPDKELTLAASKKSLTESKTLRAHAHRLLQGRHTRRLAIEFACQWLHIRNFDQHDGKNESLYPEFAGLRGKMYEESIRFFTDFFQNDRSILSLLNADHTFVDPDLAKLYALPALGEGWQRIEDIQKVGRGGILGFATTLAKQSGASRTSPILRGNWVSETLLGERLPKPPKDVPPLSDELPKGLSERELIMQHSSDPACAKCHHRIDPYGFALEAFDAIGRFRAGADTKAQLPDGTSIEGLEGLRNYLLKDRRESFVRHFCQKLLGYALGRAVQLSDQPFLDELMTTLQKHDYRIGVAVEAIVLSPQFREIRGTPHP